MKHFLPASVLLVVGIIISLMIMLLPRPGQAVAIVFPPSTSVTDAVQRAAEAGWLPITSPRSFIVMAHPGSVNTVRRPNGALLFLNARAASGCLDSEEVEK